MIQDSKLFAKIQFGNFDPQSPVHCIIVLNMVFIEASFWSSITSTVAAFSIIE